jgi:hypothetical protein
VLILDALHNSAIDSFGLYDANDVMPAHFIARVVFDYNGLLVNDQDHEAFVMKEHDGVLFEYKRDHAFEALKKEELLQHMELSPAEFWLYTHWDGVQEGDYILENIERRADLNKLHSGPLVHLNASGWRLEFLSPLYRELIDADEVDWYSELNEATTDFFSYQLGIVVEGKTVSVVPLVADLIQRHTATTLDLLPDDQLVTLPLEDGRGLQLPMGRIKPLIRLLLQFGTRQMNEKQHWQMSKYQLLLMQEAELALATTKARWQGAEALRAELQQLVQKFLL